MTILIFKLFCCFAISPISLCMAGSALNVEETTYTYEGNKVPAFSIENDFYTATLVPELGGRILDWIDKKSDTALVYDNGYGGLLDDHGARVKLPYSVEWLKRDEKEIVVRLTLEGNIRIQKTVTFSAGRSVIGVEYHVENHGQEPHRMLFRNVVRPGGTEFVGDELYCYSRVVGLQRGKGMPRTDDQADPWCALVNVPDKLAVVNTFDGDVLQRLYTWRGSKVAPTYEFMFPPLNAGHQVDLRYTWAFAHGISAVDYAHQTFVAQIEGGLKEGRLEADLSIIATWDRMPLLSVTASLLNEKREEIAILKPQAMSMTELDKSVTEHFSLKTGDVGDYVILILKLKSPVIGAEPLIIEKAFPVGGDKKRLAAYRRPVRWLGKPVVQQPLQSWIREVNYTIETDNADKTRGCMVFSEIGERAGSHVRNLSFTMAQREPEAFPLHFYSINVTGDVEIECVAPEGITLESFVPEDMPEKLWGRVRHGLKLNPGRRFAVKPNDDRILYFRLRTDEPVSGEHAAMITFKAPGVEPIEVRINVDVKPVRFPRQPFMTFDVNNVVNYLCSYKTTGLNRVWDDERAQNYLSDMEAHGVRGQTLGGVNAPNSHYWYNRVKIRSTGQSLTEAIKEDPARFRNRLDLPPLEFSEWDWLVDRLLKHGQAYLRWPMGGCGNGFMQGHASLTSRIYGRKLPSGDMRQTAVQEWYYREVTQYLKDRGIPRIFGTIDDEIPSEKLAWWVQHAYRAIQMGVEPGVTQSAETIADDVCMNIVAPFMKYWVIGTLHKDSLDQRRKQNLIKPEHRLITYHSSANHWQPYSNTRGHCGFNTAYFDLDACWIQTYYRWRQSEAIIYPGDKGPTSSAAWEGARDGLDDGNYLRLARVMTEALQNREVREEYRARIEEIVGTKETSLIRFQNKISGSGMVTSMVRHNTADFCKAKNLLLQLITELADIVPVQKASADFGLHSLICNGVVQFDILKEMTFSAKAEQFISESAGALEFEPINMVSVEDSPSSPILFMGTFQELNKLLPELSEHPDLSDISQGYPNAENYVVRFVRHPLESKLKERPEVQPESMLIICGDEAGADKALSLLGHVITQPRSQYSHWLINHRH